PLRAEEEDAARLLAHPEREDELEAGLAEGGPLRRRLLVEQEEAGLRAEAADGLGVGLGGVAGRDAVHPAVLIAEEEDVAPDEELPHEREREELDGAVRIEGAVELLGEVEERVELLDALAEVAVGL